MNKQPGLKERKAAFNARTEQYLRLGYDRFAAADFVAISEGRLTGPALDIGTGRGLMAIALARQGLDVVSVDIDAEEQALAELLATEAGLKNRTRFVRGNASALSFPDGYFDSAVMMDVLHHLTDPIPVLEEAARVLKPLGTFIMADLSADGFELLARVHREEGHEHPVSGFTLESAEAFLLRRGFAPVAHRSGHYHEVSILVKHAGYRP